MRCRLIALMALAPTALLAQTTVTLSGFAKAGMAQTRYTNGIAGTNGSNTSVADGASRFILSGREDLGGGLAAVFQSDTRWRVDDNGGAPTSSPLAGGNTFVGLAGPWGQVRLGKLDTHYCLGSDEHGARATALQASSCALLGYVGGVGAPIANGTRTVNAARYDLPSNLLSGVTGSLTYAASGPAVLPVPGFAPGAAAPGGNGNDGAIGDAGKGRALSAALGYASGPLAVATSMWRSSSESRAIGSAMQDQSAWTLTGSWNLGIAKVGLTYDRASFDSLPAAGVASEARRTAWSVPITFAIGPSTLLLTYTRASRVRVGGVDAAGTEARLWAIGFDHPLSKRTSVGVSYAAMNNGAAANYQLYTTHVLQSLPVSSAGQDQRQVYVGVRHAF